MSDVIDINDGKKDEKFKKFGIKKLLKSDNNKERILSPDDYKPLRWIIPNFVLEKGISFIVGDAKIGKTLLVMSLIAEAQKKHIGPHEKIIYLGGEDDIDSAVLPRAQVAGIDFSRFVVWEGMTNTITDDAYDVDLIEHRKNILAIITQHKAKILVIDTLGRYLGDNNLCSTTDMRRLLSPLATISKKTGCGILIIHHTHKSKDGDSLQRILGSGALHQTCRAMAQFTVNPNMEGQRILSALPGNYTSMDSKYTRVYDIQLCQTILNNQIVEAFALKLTDTVCLDTPDEILAQQPTYSDITSIKKAEIFLKDYLSDGEPKNSDEIKKEAREQGFYKSNLYRAKDNLPIEVIPIKVNNRNGTFWKLHTQYLGKVNEFSAIFRKEKKSV